MEQEQNQIVNAADSTESTKKKGLNIKVLLFGIPLFIVQLVAVYFITANFLLNRMQGSNSAAQNNVAGQVKPADAKKAEKPAELGKYIFMVEDLIINPANTDGKRLLLSSLGFDVASEQNNQELKEKEVVLKDAVISVMSGKNLSQLANMAYRDTLRTEITKKLGKLMPAVKINTIYFSKYILQ